MSYEDDHPTTYNLREDILDLAQKVSDLHGTSWNTYVDHPPGYWLDTTSCDFWGPAGRGDPIGIFRGYAVAGSIFYDPSPPSIRWLIWQGYIWEAGSGWRWFAEDEAWSDNGHFRHVHITFA